jgi:hypothetical protein
MSRRKRDPGDVTVAHELLAAARSMIERPAETTAGVWPRAAALLARQALEVSLKTYWSAKSSGTEEVSMRAQLLCLEAMISDDDIARRAHGAWGALSRACHYHAYELAPTREELLAWCEDVEVIIERTEREWRSD